MRVHPSALKIYPGLTLTPKLNPNLTMPPAALQGVLAGPAPANLGRVYTHPQRIPMGSACGETILKLPKTLCILLSSLPALKRLP